jgi:hypothetical protein
MSDVVTISPPLVSQGMFALAECVCAELIQTGAGPTCWCGVLPGVVAPHAYCTGCEDRCGMAWVRLGAVGPYERFPTVGIDVDCRRPLVYQLELGAVRCLPSPAVGEAMLDVESMAEVTLRTHLDMQALAKAFVCCAAFQISALGVWTPVESGSCVGGTWQAYVGVE